MQVANKDFGEEACLRDRPFRVVGMSWPKIVCIAPSSRPKKLQVGVFLDS